MGLTEGVWLSWWYDADWVVRGVLVLLVVLSLTSWTIIFAKLWEFGGLLGRERRLVRSLWTGAPTESVHGKALSVRVLAAVREGQDATTGLSRTVLREHIEQAVAEQRVSLESHLTLLASIGSSAPFIGLLGTVWGIMHALGSRDGSAGLSIERVAGPVGEALVATAGGLFTAIPAVVAYNLLVRRLRRISALLQGNSLRLLDRDLNRTPEGAAAEQYVAVSSPRSQRRA